MIEINAENVCRIDKGTDEWNEFVDKYGKLFENREDKTGSRSTITILNPPVISVLKRVLEVCKKRHQKLKGDYLLMGYGYNKFYSRINGFNLINKYKMIKDIKYGFSTKHEVPVVNLDFWEKKDKEVSHGTVVINVTKEQLAKINDVCDGLGFAKTYDVGFACLIYSLGDMLGKVCDSEYEIYCMEYPRKLEEKIMEQNDKLNLWIFEHLNLMLSKVIGMITSCKMLDKDYEFGFFGKLFQTIWAINEVKHFSMDDKINTLINDLEKLFKMYPELFKIVEIKENDIFGTNNLKDVFVRQEQII